MIDSRGTDGLDAESDNRAWSAIRDEVLELRLQGGDTLSMARILAREYAPVEVAYVAEMIATHPLEVTP